MKMATTISRLFLGFMMVVSGVDGFLGVLPQWPMTPEGAAFIGALRDSGYLWEVTKGAELLCGLALLAGRFVPLALTVAAPIVLNIVLFQVFIGVPSILPLDFLLLALGLFLAWAYRDNFRGVLTARAAPGPAKPEKPSRRRPADPQQNPARAS